MPIVTPSTSFTFLDAVNRVMRIEGILRGDTDAITTFSDLQHGATATLAQVAIQDELNELVSDVLLPSERDSTGSITTVQGTRTYSLPTNFTRFYGTPLLYCAADNFQLYEYGGGEDTLRLRFYTYATDQGNPYAWYINMTTSKKIGLFPVPQSAKTYTFDYEADASVASATDLLPFHNNMESHTFCRLAARRFKLLYQNKDVAALIQDPEHQKARATLAAMIVGKNPAGSYAYVYR